MMIPKINKKKGNSLHNDVQKQYKNKSFNKRNKIEIRRRISQNKIPIFFSL